MRMKFLVALLGVVLAAPVYASKQFCGVVSIEQVLTGPRHGAMMRVSGACGWVCLDPDAQYMSKPESERLFAQVLAAYSSKQKVHLHVWSNKFAIACNGGYKVVEDLRTP